MHLLGSISELYGRHGSLYASISGGRNFSGQCVVLARELLRNRRGARFLELFAGPARHAAVLASEHGALCSAIDASPEMRRIAVETGAVPAARYHLARLPDLPPSQALAGPFDGMAILLYSVGYVTPADLIVLLRKLVPMLAPGGRLAFELHDLAMVRESFAHLAIREREIVVGPDERLHCIWPARPLRWQPDDWVVEMDVVVRRLVAGRVAEEHSFVSIERMYARSEIEALGLAIGGLRPISPDVDPVPFQGSVLALLERH